jgi:NADH-quinone oxidoreductase subunit D
VLALVQLRIASIRIREIMSESMEALIHHFELVTEGFKVPAGPGVCRDRVSTPGEAFGCHTVSAPGGTQALSGALPRPLVHQPAGGCRDVRGRADRRTLIAAVAGIDPVVGGVDR